MELIVFISVFVSIVFILIKYIESKYIDKKVVPFKTIARDTVYVFSSAVLATFSYFYFEPHIREFLNVVTDTTDLAPAVTQIFTDKPGF